MNVSPIGIFDSGFGGLSIYKSIHHLLPHESTVYIGDHAYLPYGGKTRVQIRERARNLIAFLLSRKAKLIVVACNTATIAGIDIYRKWFPQIPIIGVVPVVKTAAAISKRRSFAVLSTLFTAKSEYQRRLIRKFAPDSHVYNLGCPNLLSYVEKGIVRGASINKELRSLLTPDVIRSVDVIVLGCTHYPFLEEAIRAIVGDTKHILDSGGAVARHVDRIMELNGIASGGYTPFHKFYSTGKDTSLSRVASKLIGHNITVSYADI